MELLSGARARRAHLLGADTIVTRDAEGTVFARSPHPLGAYPAKLTDRLEHWALHAPDRPFLAERDAGGQWRRVSYREALRQVRHLAQALLNRGLSADRPVLILSGNGIDHGLLALASMYCGVLYAPVAPAYSLVATEFTTLRALWASMRPGLVFAADADRFARALAALPLDGAEVVTTGASPHAMPATSLDELLDTPPTSDVEAAHARVGPDTVAKILFTSGSTGQPKGVINTQRMLCANQEQLRTVMAFLADEPPVLCDWLPWNHTFGGNHNFGIALYNGGTLYIDHGKPAPGEFDTTIRNLRDVATTACFNVPKGFEMLLPVLRADAAFRRHFFSRLQILFYAAAGLRQQTSDEIEALAVEACGERIPWVTGLGATETAPFALCTGAMPEPVAGRVGVPVPGTELKVARVGDRREARLRGPNVTPGYWKDEALTKASFDADGFYRFGDALGFVDPDDPALGFTFEGRITEDFKLSTGTWVRVGPLRARFLAAAGDLVQDVVIAGHDRDFVAALVLPNLTTCRALCGDATGALPAQEVLAHAAVIARFEALLREFAAAHPGSSMAIQRAVLLDRPLSLDAQEITDKGTINQRAVLAHRADLVRALYEDAGTVSIIDLFREQTSS